MKPTRSLLALALVALLVALVATLSAFYTEFAAEYTDAGRRGAQTVPFFTKRQWEDEVGDGNVLVVFEIPECRGSILAQFHPLKLMRIHTESGLHLLGTLQRGEAATATSASAATHLCASGISVSSFYFWSCNHGSANFMNRASWFSLRNAAFLRETGLDARVRDVLHPLLAPISLFGAMSSLDLIMLSHRSPLQTLPYFVHFLSRRVLCAAHGAFQVHFISWSDARRVIEPSECAFPSTTTETEEDHMAASWVFSAQCGLRKRARMRHAVVKEGQMLLVPPATVYTLEHVPAGSTSSCAVVLQIDFATVANRCKNGLFTPRRNHSGSGVADADEETIAAIVGDVRLAEVLTSGSRGE